MVRVPKFPLRRVGGEAENLFSFVFSITRAGRFSDFLASPGLHIP